MRYLLNTVALRALDTGGIGYASSGTPTPTPTPSPTIVYDEGASEFQITANPGTVRQWYDAITDDPISGQTATTLAYADLPAGVWLVYLIADGQTSNLAAAPPPGPAVEFSIDFGDYADGTYLMGFNWDGTAANPGNNAGFQWFGYQNGKPGEGNDLTVVSGEAKYTTPYGGGPGGALCVDLGTSLRAYTWNIDQTIWLGDLREYAVSAQQLGEFAGSICRVVVDTRDETSNAWLINATGENFVDGPLGRPMTDGDTLSFGLDLDANGGAGSVKLYVNNVDVTSGGVAITNGDLAYARMGFHIDSGVTADAILGSGFTVTQPFSPPFALESVTYTSPTLAVPYEGADVEFSYLAGPTGIKWALCDADGALLTALTPVTLTGSPQTISGIDVQAYGGQQIFMVVLDAADTTVYSFLDLGVVPFGRAKMLASNGINTGPGASYGFGAKQRNRAGYEAPYPTLSGAIVPGVVPYDKDGNITGYLPGTDGFLFRVMLSDVNTGGRREYETGVEYTFGINYSGTLSLPVYTDITPGAIGASTLKFTPGSTDPDALLLVEDVVFSGGVPLIRTCGPTADAHPERSTIDQNISFYNAAVMGARPVKRYMKWLNAEALAKGSGYWGSPSDTEWTPPPENMSATPEWVAQDMLDTGVNAQINFKCDIPDAVCEDFLTRLWAKMGELDIQDRFVYATRFNEQANYDYFYQVIDTYAQCYNNAFITGSVPATLATNQSSYNDWGTGETTTTRANGDVFVTYSGYVGVLVQANRDTSIGATIPSSGSNADFTVLCTVVDSPSGTPVGGSAYEARMRWTLLQAYNIGQMAKGIMGSQAISYYEDWLNSTNAEALARLRWLYDTYGYLIERAGPSFYAGGGIGYIQSFEGSISGTTLTVTSGTPGPLAIDRVLAGTGVTPDTTIISQLSDTTWEVSNSHSPTGTQTITATLPDLSDPDAKTAFQAAYLAYNTSAAAIISTQLSGWADYVYQGQREDGLTEEQCAKINTYEGGFHSIIVGITAAYSKTALQNAEYIGAAVNELMASSDWYDLVFTYTTDLMEGAAPDVLNWFIDYAQGSPTTFIAGGAGPFTVASSFNVVSGLQTAGVNSQFLQALSDARAALV